MIFLIALNLGHVVQSVEAQLAGGRGRRSPLPFSEKWEKIVTFKLLIIRLKNFIWKTLKSNTAGNFMSQFMSFSLFRTDL